MERYFDRLSDDLETFAAHAKRKTIEVEDVELLLRRCVCCLCRLCAHFCACICVFSSLFHPEGSQVV